MLTLLRPNQQQQLREMFPQYVEPPLPVWGRWLVLGLFVGLCAMTWGFVALVVDLLARL